MRAEQYWREAMAVSERALDQGSLVPQNISPLIVSGVEPFILNRLVTPVPRVSFATGLPSEAGPHPNPFLPWETSLEIARLASSHALILNKFPVEACHLILITQDWQPQGGWLSKTDWQAVAHVAADTPGLWFFNSVRSAGASQPHRHVQLLPRHSGDPSCPLAPLLQIGRAHV